MIDNFAKNITEFYKHNIYILCYTKKTSKTILALYLHIAIFLYKNSKPLIKKAIINNIHQSTCAKKTVSKGGTKSARRQDSHSYVQKIRLISK